METTNFSYARTLKELKIAYLGKVAQSAKMEKSFKNGTMTYCLYLAPWNLSGYNVCPWGIHCKDSCLNASGRNRCGITIGGVEHSHINISRIKKTRLFYEHKDIFMQLVIHEINKYIKKAKEKNMEFSIRLNGTSDISPEKFTFNGKNLLEMYPDVRFYDYTKGLQRFELTKKYPNYSLTFSFDGYNWNKCEEVLRRGGNVAVVFADDTRIPKSFNGWGVCDGNKSDTRYYDEPQKVVCLHYHRCAQDYKNGKYIEPNTPFVIKATDKRVIY